MSHKEKVLLIEKRHNTISVSRQTELLGISRASAYYEPTPKEEDMRIMRVIDEIFTRYPFYGSRRMRHVLARDHAIAIGREHIQRLMHTMGIVAIYPKKRTTIAHPAHLKYPYLLTNVVASYPNHIWGTDITYIRLETGWCYLAAIIDWFSRKVLAWMLSATMEETFCVETLGKALTIATPVIHNSDQGSQFTGDAYVSVLQNHSIAISMDGRGRCMDNIFTERLWKTVKYENIYLSSYHSIEDAQRGLETYFAFYNRTRPHQSLRYATPDAVYHDTKLYPSAIKGRDQNQKLAAVGS